MIEAVHDPWLYYRSAREGGAQWSADRRNVFVFSYELARRVLIGDHFSTSHPFRATRHVIGPALIDTEGASHSRLKRAAAGLLRPPSAMRLIKEYGETIVDDLLAGLSTGLTFDVAARELPLRVLASVLGIELSDSDWWLGRLQSIASVIEGVGRLEDGVVARRELDAALEDVLDAGAIDHRAQSQLANWTELARPEQVRLALALLFGGTETTTIALKTVFGALAENPDWAGRLRDDPTKVRGFVNECLRWDPPVHQTVRFPTRDTTVGHHAVPRGTHVHVVIGSGSRGQYEDGDVWDPTRVGSTAEALTFGAGRHSCPGWALAMAEIVLMVTRIVTAFDVAGSAISGPRGPTVVFGRNVLDLQLSPL